MRAVRRLSTVSGRLAKSSPCWAAKTSSRTKSGFPPARSASAADRVDGQREAVGNGDRQLLRRVRAEGRQLDARSRPGGRDDGALARPGRHADEPGSHGGLCDEMGDEETRCVVEPVRVLDHDQRRHHQDALEERRHRLVQPVARRRRIEDAALGGRGHRRVERDREERKPGREIGHHARRRTATSCAPASSRDRSAVIPTSWRSSERNAPYGSLEA